MGNSENSKQAVVEVGPANNPYAKIIVPEKRNCLKDRRKLHTYVAEDLRNGLSDRRKCNTQDPLHVKRDIEDRRKIYTYVADDRRSGIAERRNRRRFLPPLWEVVVADSQQEVWMLPQKTCEKSKTLFRIRDFGFAKILPNILKIVPKKIQPFIPHISKSN